MCLNHQTIGTYLDVQCLDSVVKAVRAAQVWRTTHVFATTLLDYHALIVSSIPEQLHLLGPQVVDQELTSGVVESTHRDSLCIAGLLGRWSVGSPCHWRESTTWRFLDFRKLNILAGWLAEIRLQAHDGM
jgi:hypothetical protein